MTVTTALYRRYRPDSFADVIGQEHVTEPLMTALRKNRVNHAYLFSGPRGCGKTTSARILARCLNCAQGPTDTPCGTCPSCVELARGGSGSLDVIEIDAASHGGVDDARDLRERATYAPVRDRYKIFIIDEAHMVTSAGFNALLKIVEEPPEHIKFIFATTEPDKVIGTIRSRTHHYPFRLVPPEPLMAYLELLCRQENVPVAPGVLSLVIRAGGGSVRDSLSVLDQLMAGAGPNGLDYELAVALLGYTHASLLDDVVEAVAASDAATVFRAVDRVIQTGHDPRRFVEDLLERFRDLIIVQAMPESAHAILRGMPADQIARLQNQAHNLGAAELSRAADVTNTALTEMTGATSPRLHLELLCARILLPSAEQNERGMAARIDRVERRLNYAGNDVGAAAPAAAPAPSESAPAAPVQAPAAAVQAPAAPVPAPAAPVPAPAAPVQAPAPAGSASGPASGPASPGPRPGQEAGQPALHPGQDSPDQPTNISGATAATRPQEPERETPASAGQAAPAVPTSSSAGAASGSSQAAAAPDARSSLTPPRVSTNDWPVEEPARGRAPQTPAAAAAPRATPPPAAQEEPARSAPAAPPAMGDVEVLRRAWPDVLQTLSKIKRSTWALVEPNAQVSAFDGSILTLSFTTSGLAGAFGRADHSDNLRQAIHTTVGIDLQINAVAGGASQASSEPNPKVPASPVVPATSADVAWGLAPAPAESPAGTAAKAPAATPAPAPAPAASPAPEAAASPAAGTEPAPPAASAPVPPAATTPASAAVPAHAASSPAPSIAARPAADNQRRESVPPAAEGAGARGTVSGPSRTESEYPSAAGDYSYSDDDWGPPRDEDAPPLDEEPPMDWEPSARGSSSVKPTAPTAGADRPSGSSTRNEATRTGQPATAPAGTTGHGEAPSAGAAHDPWARAVEQAPGVWVVGDKSNVGTPSVGASADDSSAPAAPAPVPHYEPATAQVPPAIPASAPKATVEADWGVGTVNDNSREDAVRDASQPAAAQPAPEPEFAMASAGPATAAPSRPQAPAAAPSTGRPDTRQSLYQRLSNSPEAEAGRAKAPSRAAAAPTAYVQDIPSADDETIEESGVFGRAAVERILGGKLIEERSTDGSPIAPRY
ncbi:DNA polymerase III subunit gamma and tau [Pseudarthrobacter sp. fls2-241-R2A-127]|uniref:DNA polymerase III subunit gamma and tau n=1 Tax=Pseudarthrobacter sp. fls2-241-R2A-127 TaxID=3040303 RepID=UPI0025573951|nr:DNA polymerase III subunit gamma and tau [Pseudarthrobacter sp. fls2-241-R2A-127]